jgi:hypothetical protein
MRKIFSTLKPMENRMQEKYMITHDGKAIIFKFNFLKMELTIGGYTKHRPFIESIITTYYNVSVIPEMQFPQRNKLRYTIKCIPAKFREILAAIKNDNAVSIEQVRAHGRML